MFWMPIALTLDILDADRTNTRSSERRWIELTVSCEAHTHAASGRTERNALLVCVDAAGKVDAVAVGADRVAANGDTANKIGTLQLAIAAAHYAIPFLVVAPLTSCDPEVGVFCVSLVL